MRPPLIVVLGAATGPRAEAFRAALSRLVQPQAEFLSYERFLRNPGALAALLQAGTIVRFDSPDRERESLCAIYQAGAASAAAGGTLS